MDQLIMLNLMQTPGEWKASTGSKSSDPEGFQKLMEQSQGNGQASGTGKQTAGTAKPGDTAEAPKAETVEEGQTKPVQNDPELEKQMVLAAMAVLQNPVVPVEQVMTPEGAVAETAEAAGAVEMVEAVEGLTAETVAAEELPLEVELEAVETVEAAAEAPEAPEEEAEAVEVDVEPLKAPEAAEESAGPKELEVEVRSEGDSKPETEETVEVSEGMAEQPVFGNVREIPVKVGEAPAAEKTEEPVEVQVGNQLTEAISKGETKVEIQLTPENLGKIRVEMTLNENGGLLIQLHAENSRTQGLLEKNLSGLEALLSRNSEQEVQVEVPRQQESQQQQQNLFDQEQKQQHQRQQQPRQEQPQNSEDFLQQLRLGLIPVDGEET